MQTINRTNLVFVIINMYKTKSSFSLQLKSYDDKRIQIGAFEEATTHYEAKIKDLHAENDKIRDQYNNMHYENAILKCKFESREAEYSRALERINLQHQGEVIILQKKTIFILLLCKLDWK